MAVTAECIDPSFNADNFVVDKVTEASVPSPHTRVDARFKATATTPEYKVALHLPPRGQWQGRFFQHTYPLDLPENPDAIAFALANGGYFLEVEGSSCGCRGYRVDAAAAKLAREYARRFYPKAPETIYGYLFGGSGGALQTLGAAENTSGVWQGAIPFVMPNEGSLLNANAAGSLASLALHDKLADISEAVKPGSRTDPFATLTAEQRAIFQETLQMGFPLRTFESVFSGGVILMYLSGGVQSEDRGYVDDFWSKPGYEGTNPPGYLERAKIDKFATVAQVATAPNGTPTTFTLDSIPDVGAAIPMSIGYWLYKADGKTKIGTLSGELKGATFTLSGNNDPAVVKQVASGAKLRVNNLFFLALHFYHRHALPKGPGHYTYDQFRNPDGSPRYPQRSFRASTEQAVGTAGGGTQTGKITMKVIVNQSMVDGGAHPWMADWYSKRVLAALGKQGHADNFRLWYNDNAEHVDTPSAGASVASVINYVPALYQGMRDLVAWVERGVPAPRSSQYTVNAGQITLLPKAADRRGIQPVVDLSVNGTDRIEVAVNQPVEFVGSIEVPPSAGKVVSTGWWFGEGTPAIERSPLAQPNEAIRLKQSHTYRQPGTYYVTLFATSQREGNTQDTSTAIQNLDRVRVVVR